MDLTTERVPVARMPWRAIGALVGLLALLLAASLAVYIGSQPRLPDAIRSGQQWPRRLLGRR